MRLSPCRFKLPLTDNEGQPIAARVIIELHHELLVAFEGFTIHPTSKGRWVSRAGQLYQEEVVVYEVAVPKTKVAMLRDVVCGLGRGLGQLAMYFDAPAPSVEIIDLSAPPKALAAKKGGNDESRQDEAARRRGKKNRRPR